MGVHTKIRGYNNVNAKVQDDDPNNPGLVVYSRELYRFSPLIVSFQNETNGSNMAVDASLGGTPEGVHNGTDTVLWAGSNLSGANFVFNSATNPATGSFCIEAVAVVNGSQALFEDATNTDMDLFTGISGDLRIERWDVSGSKAIELVARLNGVVIGNSIDLNNFVDVSTLDVYQNFFIPKAAMGLASQVIDELVISVIHTGGGQPPEFRLDNFQIEETGGAVYSIKPGNEDVWEVDGFEMIVTFPSGSTLADATMNNLSGENFFGLSLVNGIRLFALSTNELVLNENFLNIRDFLLIGYEIVNTMSNGTNTTVSMKWQFPQGATVLSQRKDEVAFELSDNFSSFSFFRMNAIGRSLSGLKVLSTPQE